MTMTQLSKNASGKSRKITPRFIAEAGMIAALYVVLTYLSSLVGLSSGAIQVRLSEALAVLVFFTPAAIPGLTIGCALANAITGAVPLDILFGTLATFNGAVFGYCIGKIARQTKSRVLKLLVPLPNVVVNMIVVPFVLRIAYGVGDAVWFLMLTVGAGELISGVLLGLPLLFALERHAPRLFDRQS